MKILFLYAHADDECLGAGGTIARLAGRGHELQLLTVSDGLLAKRGEGGDNRGDYAAACRLLGLEDFQMLGFPDQAFDTVGMADLVNAIAAAAKPFDLVVTHDAGDLNKDHRVVAEAAKVIGRPRGQQVGILTSEIPCAASWNGNAFQPNFFVDISESLSKKKAAFQCYGAEVRAASDPFSPEGLEALAKFRGLECGLPHAEAFKVIRWMGDMQL